jgi:MarR family transcriptional regulator, 2-MHQ and catechol-resistance regulon repressor
MRALRDVGQRIDTRIGEVFAAAGLSHGAGNVLAVIEGAGRPIPAGEIGPALHITSGSVTSVLDTLERKNLVRRYRDPDDRRRVLVDITVEAEELLDEVLPLVAVRSRDLAETLSGSDRRTLLELVRRVDEHARDLDRPPVAPGGRHTPAGLRAPRTVDGRRQPVDDERSP